jgi:4-hydroxyphenylacetate 3-monooxygenase
VGIRTGQQYLDALNGRRTEIYVNGERVTSRVANHPAFRDSARTYAHLFDMQHDPAHSAALTYASPLTGDPVSASFLIPRDQARLVRRREAFSAWAGYSHGFLGRSGDYMNSALTALAAAEKFFGKTDPVFGERLRAYYEHARDNDLLATHTLVPPQVNRSVTASLQGGGQLTAHVVAQRADGVVIRGARLLATLGPIADELLVFPSTVLRGTADDAPYSFAFAIPNDTPGLRYYCRAPLHYGGGAFDEPLASRFDEMDAIVVFDDVLVPHERIFMLGNPALCNAWYSETGAGALMGHQVVTRTLAKTEFYLGLASEIAATIGIEQFQHIQEDLAELIAYVEIEKALLRAAEADGELSDDGVFLPRWATLNAARNWYPRKVSQRLPEIIRKFSASGLMALPSEADFALASQVGNTDLDTYLQAATATATDRARLFKLALDASVSGFAGRESLYEYYFFGDPVRMASAMLSGYDRGPARARVRDLLGDSRA